MVESSTNQPQSEELREKKHVGRKLFSLKGEKPRKKVQEHLLEDDMLANYFNSRSESSLGINCNVVFVLHMEHDQVIEVEETEEANEGEMAKYKPVCYYIMNNGCIEEHNFFFERPDEGIKCHLKPLFIMGKLKNTRVNKILVNGGATVNLMLQFMLRRIRMFDIDLKPHNMLLSNYEGKIGYCLGEIQVDLNIPSITRLTMFMVIASGANYNLFMGRELIHGIRATPSLLHQRVSIWREEGTWRL